MAQKEFLRVDFDPDVRKVRQDLMRIQGRLKDKREVLGAAMAVAREDVKANFDGEHDSSGTAWEPWKSTAPSSKRSESYSQRAERFPNLAILNRTGNLRNAATDIQAFAISAGGQLTYGFGLPRWAGVHLHGGVKVSADGYKMPQRSWYPYSLGGIEKVHALFDAWMIGAITIQSRISSRGRSYTQVQTRTESGRFGPSAL